MLSFLKKDPLKQVRKEYLVILKKSHDAQRNGDIKTYSYLTEKAEKILATIDELDSKYNNTNAN